ncbi:MAG TPA: AmmeMemoRadiSam system protein A [Chromatiales bacterium]|nr:AmmeMemoRadiSam system protein A [Chromatiales bacterium]
MPSTEKQTLNDELRATLLEVARDSIRYGLQHGRPLTVDPADYPEPLGEERASFVTLNIDGRLRGCMGHLEAVAPLVVDVADNAYAAAFRDPRFPPLSNAEFDDLELHISVLSKPEPMQFSSEEDLLKQIRPGEDGLILEDGFAKGTFLPSVWESLPKARDFLAHLKVKAGLPPDYWSPSLKVYRYETESFA